MLKANVLRAMACLTCFGLGALTSYKLRPAPQVVTVEHVTEGQKEIVTVERVVIKTTKPDGTVIERTEDKAQTLKQERREVRERPIKSPAAKPVSRYSTDVRYLPSLSDPPSARDVAVDVGYRIGQSRAWVTTGYDVKHNQLSVGIRYEW